MLPFLSVCSYTICVVSLHKIRDAACGITNEGLKRSKHSRSVVAGPRDTARGHQFGPKARDKQEVQVPAYGGLFRLRRGR